METVPIFDWLRWVEVPVWILLGSWLAAHIRHDHCVEVEIKRELGKLEGIEATLALILDKIIPEKSED